jgi:sodium-independent sulfate anion transporter 11
LSVDASANFRHLTGVVISPPWALYEFYKINPLDVLVFGTGMFITIFSTTENGIFAMIIISACILLIRQCKAQGAFLNRVKIQANDAENGGDSISRDHFVPLDRRDGSNPDVRIERPHEGVFIYRFTDGFSFINANHRLSFFVDAIPAETRPTTIEEAFTKPRATYKMSIWTVNTKRLAGSAME